MEQNIQNVIHFMKAVENPEWMVELVEGLVEDKKKLNALIAYIADAERYHLDMAAKGSVENGIRSQAIQDITLFMEHELGIKF